MDAETEVAMVAMLSASLALVRPVGMTERETEDWLTVAVDALSHLPLRIFDTGVRIARQTCTHHSQIVPAIIAATKEALAWHNSPAPVLRLVSPAPVEEVRKQPLPDPASLMPSLRRMGIEKGWIVNRAGKLVWSEDAA